MKRELKLAVRAARKCFVADINCKAYPDEKGIETGSIEIMRQMMSHIAKPIPMKRELKRFSVSCSKALIRLLLQSLSR